MATGVLNHLARKEGRSVSPLSWIVDDAKMETEMAAVSHLARMEEGRIVGHPRWVPPEIGDPVAWCFDTIPRKILLSQERN